MRVLMRLKVSIKSSAENGVDGGIETNPSLMSCSARKSGVRVSLKKSHRVIRR